jgi:hypothetical protein
VKEISHRNEERTSKTMKRSPKERVNKRKYEIGKKVILPHTLSTAFSVLPFSKSKRSDFFNHKNENSHSLHVFNCSLRKNVQ